MKMIIIKSQDFWIYNFDKFDNWFFAQRNKIVLNLRSFKPKVYKKSNRKLKLASAVRLISKDKKKVFEEIFKEIYRKRYKILKKRDLIYAKGNRIGKKKKKNRNEKFRVFTARRFRKYLSRTLFRMRLRLFRKGVRSHLRKGIDFRFQKVKFKTTEDGQIRIVKQRLTSFERRFQKRNRFRFDFDRYKYFKYIKTRKRKFGDIYLVSVLFNLLNLSYKSPMSWRSPILSQVLQNSSNVVKLQKDTSPVVFSAYLCGVYEFNNTLAVKLGFKKDGLIKVPKKVFTKLFYDNQYVLGSYGFVDLVVSSKPDVISNFLDFDLFVIDINTFLRSTQALQTGLVPDCIIFSKGTDRPKFAFDDFFDFDYNRTMVVGGVKKLLKVRINPRSRKLKLLYKHKSRNMPIFFNFFVLLGRLVLLTKLLNNNDLFKNQRSPYFLYRCAVSIKRIRALFLIYNSYLRAFFPFLYDTDIQRKFRIFANNTFVNSKNSLQQFASNEFSLHDVDKIIIKLNPSQLSFENIVDYINNRDRGIKMGNLNELLLYKRLSNFNFLLSLRKDPAIFVTKMYFRRYLNVIYSSLIKNKKRMFFTFPNIMLTTRKLRAKLRKRITDSRIKSANLFFDGGFNLKLKSVLLKMLFFGKKLFISSPNILLNMRKSRRLIKRRGILAGMRIYRIRSKFTSKFIQRLPRYKRKAAERNIRKEIRLAGESNLRNLNFAATRFLVNLFQSEHVQKWIQTSPELSARERYVILSDFDSAVLKDSRMLVNALAALRANRKRNIIKPRTPVKYKHSQKKSISKSEIQKNNNRIIKAFVERLKWSLNKNKKRYNPQ